MNLNVRKVLNINLSKSLIWIAFIVWLIRFGYMYVNEPYIRSSLMVNNIMTMSRNNMYSNLMLIIFIACFTILALKSILKCKKNIAMFYVIVMFFFGVFWTIISVYNIGIVNVFKSTITPFIFIMSICIYIGYSDEIWNEILKTISFSTIILTLIAAYETYRYVTQCGMLLRLTVSGAMYGLVSAVFLMYVTLLLNDKAIKNHKIILLIQIFTLFIVAIVVQSRSWVIHLIIILCIYIYKVSKKYKYSKLAMIAIIMLVIGVILISWNGISMLSTGLVSRMSSDSRSDQLTAFFSQVTIKDLFLGKGIMAKYYWRGVYYEYLDNLILINMFKFGMIPMISYLLLILKPIFYGIFHKTSMARSSMIFLLAWLMAMLGFSIYVSYSLNIYNFVIYIVIGRTLYCIENEKSMQRM